MKKLHGILLAVALNTAMAGPPTIREVAPGYAQLVDLPDYQYAIKKGSLDSHIGQDGRPMAALSGRTLNHTTGQILFFRWMVASDECMVEGGRTLTTLTGEGEFVNDILVHPKDVTLPQILVRTICGAHKQALKLAQ